MRLQCVIRHGGVVMFAAATVGFVSGQTTAVSTQQPSAQSCQSLASLKLPNTTITAAEAVAAGTFSPSGGGKPIAEVPEFCRVAATLTPSADSDIKIEVWLPTGWNGRFQAVGNGGWNGTINRNALADGARLGYAVAATDTGHEGGGGPWMQSQEKLVDFGHRAVHEMTVAAKAIAAAHYGRAATFSYFVGCSAGGRQGLKAAQQYPEDFNGIVAGAPALNTTGRAAYAISVAQTLHKNAASYLPATKYPAIHDAVLKACDAGDGVTDGVVDNPRQCQFDPTVLQCKAGEDSPTCLTQAQVESTRKMYTPLVNPRTGETIFPGLAYGSELGWGTFGGQQPFGLAVQMYQHMVFGDPAWDYKTLNFDADMARVDKIENGAINAMDPNLKAFFARGGKLIQYHGWADPQIPAGSSVEYYESVLEAMGGAGQVTRSYRLFMVPGMNHCGGGPGTTSFDMLTPLEEWVEQGYAPDRITASHLTDGKPDRTRPLCPYPQVATYRGSGSTDVASSFVCK
jgi:feruloyl esterase